jgi:signal transduction histidine kinase
MIRSIVPRIVIWLLGTVAFALVGCMMTAHVVATRLAGNNDFISATQQLQVDSACHILDRDGPAALHDYLERMNSLFRAKHYLADAGDRDAVDGKQLTELVRRTTHWDWKRDLLTTNIVLQRVSADGRHRLLIEISPPFGPLEILPYFIWVFVVILAIGYAMAIYFVRPLKVLRNAVEQFGKGQLDARAGLSRRDEFGDLGRAFDQMAQRIEGLVKAERLLLQDISHELRSPLTRLRFALELARDTQDREAAFQRVHKEVARLTDLVDQLLQLTRAEGDVAARNLVDISLSDLLSELIDDFQLEADSKECVLNKRLETDRILRGDYELVRRAFENVLSNALRHAPSHSDVTIDLSVDGPTTSVAIRDQGSGVPEEMLTEIFKPFRRVESDRDRDSGGLGLGLSIARRAIHLCQGTIAARNVHPGLEIQLTFPFTEMRTLTEVESIPSDPREICKEM